jgi:hypothetical protein
MLNDEAQTDLQCLLLSLIAVRIVTANGTPETPGPPAFA